jgi:hypothetical protein
MKKNFFLWQLDREMHLKCNRHWKLRTIAKF